MLRRFLTKEDRKFLSGKIAEAEAKTSGEIRVVLRHRRQRRERLLSLHELALQEFHRLEMLKTPLRTGVLILLLLSEKKFHIIADEGIHARVQYGTWDTIASTMSGHFKKGNFREGIAQAIERVGAVLVEYFPRADGKNRLSDQVIEE